jgi:hypothetical protein
MTRGVRAFSYPDENPISPWLIFTAIITILFSFSFLLWLAQPRSWKQKPPNTGVTLLLFLIFLILVAFGMARYWVALVIMLLGGRR